ncbi:MAG: hypothetical protein K2P59_10130 [Acetatifactor sp.]|nr:hypothetical protein [Acetatifactor sp.]
MARYFNTERICKPKEHYMEEYAALIGYYQETGQQEKACLVARQGTPTDDNGDCADLDKLNAQVINGQFLRSGVTNNLFHSPYS